MSKLEQAIATAKTQIAELRQTLLEESQSLFGGAAKEFFAEYPELESFSFTAYTPYFCDGDECTYSVHTWNSNTNFKTPVDKNRASEISKAAGHFIQSFDDNFWENLVGDHVKVTVSEQRIITEEYEHD